MADFTNARHLLLQKQVNRRLGKKFWTGSVRQRGNMTPVLQMETEARGFPDLPREYIKSP